MNLSDKRKGFGVFRRVVKEAYYSEDDLKEAIKELKEVVLDHYKEKRCEVTNEFEDGQPIIKLELNPIISKINKIFGPKLTKEDNKKTSVEKTESTIKRLKQNREKVNSAIKRLRQRNC